jgi:hypothetical protein
VGERRIYFYFTNFKGWMFLIAVYLPGRRIGFCLFNVVPLKVFVHGTVIEDVVAGNKRVFCFCLGFQFFLLRLCLNYKAVVSNFYIAKYAMYRNDFLSISFESRHFIVLTKREFLIDLLRFMNISW